MENPFSRCCSWCKLVDHKQTERKSELPPVTMINYYDLLTIQRLDVNNEDERQLHREHTTFGFELLEDFHFISAVRDDMKACINAMVCFMFL